MNTRLNGTTALVTGASSGLGADFSRQLAQMGADLIITARREEKLRELKNEIEQKYQVSVTVIPADLSQPEGPEDLYGEIQRKGMQVDILINNAGFGAYGPFLEVPWEKEAEMINLDIKSLVHLTKLFTPPMIQRGKGYVLQIASIASYQPSPLYASYGGAKSFVLHYGEAVGYELKGTGVSCTVLSPGVTKTGFLEVAGQSPTLYQRLVMMESEKVVAVGLKALFKRKQSIVPGLINKMTTVMAKVLPRRLLPGIAYRTMKQ